MSGVRGWLCPGYEGGYVRGTHHVKSEIRVPHGCEVGGEKLVTFSIFVLRADMKNTPGIIVEQRGISTQRKEGFYHFNLRKKSHGYIGYLGTRGY